MIKNQLSIQRSPRKDYTELLELSLIFLGETTFQNKQIKIRLPGALHRARFMSRGIYSLKIFAFRNQFKLTDDELSGLTEFNIFLVKIYVEHWFKCTLATNAALNDIFLIQQIQEYSKTNFYVAEAALEIMSRHLWYLSEIAIGLSFFDPRHSPKTLNEMASALNNPRNQQNLFRYKCFSKEANLKIVDLVSENTNIFFDITGTHYDFIHSPSSSWHENEDFRKIQQFAINLTVVNDPAERAIGLLKTVNHTLVMENSEQNDLIQVIEHFHKMHPNYNKSTVLANLKK